MDFSIVATRMTQMKSNVGAESRIVDLIPVKTISRARPLGWERQRVLEQR
jgi:hypothetical protein